MIRYIFKFNSGEIKQFDIDFDAHTPLPDPVPEWMLLETNKCPNCPMKSCDSNICPAALEVRPIIDAFQDTLSTEKIFVRVETPERIYEKHVDAQRGLMAIIGLLMAKSDCPLLNPMKGLAKFHLPFASPEEALFRSVSSYFLKQYFKNKKGQLDALDLTGLATFYEELNILNYHFLQRIRLASKKDANLNALAVLHTLSSIVLLSLDEQLEILRDQFS